MVIQKKWMLFFLFKDFFSVFKRFILGGIFTNNHHLLILNEHGSHVTLKSIKHA
jgi:hypothetical protein